jgi:hypothetical protein
VHLYALSDVYQVCLIVSHDINSDTFCRLVNVGVSSVNEGQTAPFEVLVYPNPFSSSLTLELSGLDYLHGRSDIYDITGRQVSTKNWSGRRLDLNLEHLPLGAYFYVVVTDRGDVKAGTIIKQ